MFTLTYPITLPAAHTFFDNGQYPVPLLPEGLSLHCVSFGESPLFLRISGFNSEQDALSFCPTLRNALRIATLDSSHSITPSVAAPVVSKEKQFNGDVPTVTATQADAQPYHVTGSMQQGLHISVLSKLVANSLILGTAAKLNAAPLLALSLELYSDCDFAGERNAQFVVLMTALEVLIPKGNSKGKRGGVIALVKHTLAKSHQDGKSQGKILDGLYIARNNLLHEGLPVSDSDLDALKTIVRLTLKGLLE